MAKIALTPEQKAVADQLKFTMSMHASFDKGHQLNHSCTYKGMTIFRLCWTPKSKGGGFGKASVEYAIDNEKKYYATVVELLDELIKRTLKPSSNETPDHSS